MRPALAAASHSLLPTLAAVAACLVAAIAAASQVTLGFRALTAEDARRIRIAERPALLSELRVVSAGGAEYKLWDADPGARAWLVTFMYTRCPSVCLSLGTELQQLQRVLRSSAPGVRLASISFDRAHDTQAALAEYAQRFGADPALWLIATPSSNAALERLLAQAGVVVIDDGMGGYAHNAAIHVIAPTGRLLRIFDMAQYREALAFAAALSR